MSILEKIAAPISDVNAIGEKLDDDPTLNFIDEELMKVGSLSHADIPWSKVEESAVELLSTKTKDIKLLSNLLQCLQQEADIEALLLSLQVFNIFIEKYWSIAYPTPGDKGKSIRNRFYKQIMQRNTKAVKRLEANGEANGEAIERIDGVLATLQKTLEDAALDLSLYNGLKSAFSDLNTAHEVESPQMVEETAPDTQSKLTQAPDAPQVYFDPKNERAARAAMFTMAGFLNKTNPGSAMGYRVRRNALWFSVWSLPNSKNDNVTELAAFSSERYSDYCSLLEKQPTLELLVRLERSIEQAPYWFDGQYLSYQLSEKLGYTKVAQAIKEEVQDFVLRFPQILQYKAQSGEAFANAATQQWLQQSATGERESNDVSESEHDWQLSFQQLLSVSHKEGLNVAFGQLNEQLKSATSPREQHYWRLLSADLLNAHGLSAMAQGQYQVLLDSVQGMSVTQWEPAFSGHVQQTLENMES